MAEQRVVLRDPLAFVSKAAQCPNCFSFNHPEYLPEKAKQTHAFGLLITCLVCGTPYESGASVPQAA